MITPKGEINDKVFELIKDEGILKKMEACSTPEACYEIAKEKIDIGFEEFKSSMGIGYSYVKESESGLLSEADLDQVAGGKSQGIDGKVITDFVHNIPNLHIPPGVLNAASAAAV